MSSPSLVLLSRCADRAASLPWPLGVLLALLSLACWQMASLAPMGPATRWLTAHAAGWVGAFVEALPLLGLSLAALSFWGRQRHQRRLAALVRDPDTEALVRLRPREVEQLLLRLYTVQGYEHNAHLDEPNQWVMWFEGEKQVFHAQHWRALRVGVEVVRELRSVIEGIGAEGGVVFSTGTFSAAAQSYANGRSITLVDGPTLLQLLRNYDANRLGPAVSVPPPSQDIRRLPPTQVLPGVRRMTPSPRPQCPHCSRPMLRRHELDGPHAGEPYWGCAGFPVCSGRRPLA